MAITGKTTVVAVHGAWADGSSWKDVILGLEREALRVIAAPNLTSVADDTAAVKRAISRSQGPVVLAGHAYAGAVIAAVNDERVKALVYIAGLAPDEGETVAQVFYRDKKHSQSPQLARMQTVSSGCRTRDLEMPSHRMRRQNKSRYR